ncbi:hypothetical protein [Streptomyces sp. 142MFCol3.1]|nr:hypothetical protein [Streptomyces sp. 142MFCol3.1]
MANIARGRSGNEVTFRLGGFVIGVALDAAIGFHDSKRSLR